MQKAPQFHANERIDKEDLEALVSYVKDTGSDHRFVSVLDNQSRISRGFRIEIPDQASYPGRMVVHGGAGFDFDGKMLYNDDQRDVSRTITLEGATTTFYVEVEFTEADSDLDARSFWDPTVDQGLDVSGDELPDGQEFSNNIATRLAPDWIIVQPVNTSGFERDQTVTINSTKIPLVRLTTDGANAIISATTEKAASTMLQQISATEIRIQNAQLFRSGYTINVSDGIGFVESATISSVNHVTGVLVISAIDFTGNHVPGAIVKVTSVAAPEIVEESGYGRYRRLQLTGITDHRDKLYQGDEIHGDILSRGHSLPAERSDVNLQNLKDHVDFLSAQLQELKWGIMDPYVSDTDANRAPPGISTSFPTTPRYFDRAGGVAAARYATIAVGDGIASFGDFNGGTQAVLTAALSVVPTNGRIYLKDGVYTLSSDFVINKGVMLESSPGALIVCSSGSINVATTGVVILKGLRISSGTTAIGIVVDTSDPSGFEMHGCNLTNAAFNIDAALPIPTGNVGDATVIRDCKFTATNALMIAVPLITSTAPGILSGLWDHCVFEHSSGLGMGNCLLELTAATTSLSRCRFVECSFMSTAIPGAANLAQIGLGSGPTKVLFDHCLFGTSSSLSHVTATGGSELIFRDCSSFDISPFLVVGGVSDLVINGFHNTAWPWLLPMFLLTNCNNIKIEGINVPVNSAASIVNSAIRIACDTGDLKDILIDGCTFKGESGVLGTGIIFDLANGTSIQNIRITNCYFQAVETGVYFQNSGAPGEYKNVSICNNIFSDEGVSANVALNQKIGILGSSTSTKYCWNITGNIFRNLNPANVLTISGETRHAIDILNTANYDFTIANNVIENVGDATFALAAVSGIRFVGISNSVINGNRIQGVKGTSTFGISLADGSNLVSDVSVTGNSIELIQSSVNEAAAIILGSGTNINITGNEFSSIYPASSGALILWEETSGYCTGVTISGNSGASASINLDFLSITIDNIKNVTVSGNSFGGTFRYGVLVECDTGGELRQLAITGNSYTSTNHSIRINNNSNANVEHVTINGNTLKVTGADSTNISLDTMRLIAITGNFLEMVNATASNAENIICANVTLLTIIGNVMKISNDGDNILLAAGCDLYSIVANICDKGGGAVGASINTNGASTSFAFNALNLCDDSGSVDPNDSGINTYVAGSGNLIEY